MGKINIGKIYKFKINDKVIFVIKDDNILEYKVIFVKFDRVFVFFVNVDIVYFFLFMLVYINDEL